MPSKRFSGYSHPMNNKKYFIKTKKTGFVLGVALMVALAKCVGNANGQDAGASVGINVTPPVMVPPPLVQDNYVYYPTYSIYYNSSQHQYIYLHAGLWVSNAIPGMSLPVLLASPSVNMDFHDSPEKHHAVTEHKYPKNWAPPGSDDKRP
jgi:hypothetical protein